MLDFGRRTGTVSSAPTDRSCGLSTIEPESERPSETLIRPAIALALSLLLLHVIAAVGAADARLLPPHAVGWLRDGAIPALLAAASSALTRLRRRTWARLAGQAGFGLPVAAAMSLALYPRLLPVFPAAPANIVTADAAATGTFFRHYVGVRALRPSAVVPAAGHRLSLVWVGRRGLTAADFETGFLRRPRGFFERHGQHATLFP